MTEHYDEVPSGEYRMSPEVRAMLEGRTMQPVFDAVAMLRSIDSQIAARLDALIAQGPDAQRFIIRNVTPVIGDDPNHVTFQIDADWGYEARGNHWRGLSADVAYVDELHGPFTEDHAGEDIEINGERFYYTYPTHNTPGRLMPLDPDVRIAEYRQPMIALKAASAFPDVCMCSDRQIWTAPIEGVDDELVKPYAWL